jgi:hypothetical protein
MLVSQHRHKAQPFGWPWALLGVLVGFPIVVVMPPFTALVAIVLVVAGIVSRHQRHGVRLIAVGIGLLVPVGWYFGLALAHS